MKVTKAGGATWYYTGHIGDFTRGFDDSGHEVYYQPNSTIMVYGKEYTGLLMYDRVEQKWYLGEQEGKIV